MCSYSFNLFVDNVENLNKWERKNLDKVKEDDEGIVNKRKLEEQESIVCFFYFIFVNIDISSR